MISDSLWVQQPIIAKNVKKVTTCLIIYVFLRTTSLTVLNIIPIRTNVFSVILGTS